jgi:hypothetical protein
MRRSFEEARAILERHGGTVEKFIGDAVMAGFGVPRAHEDDALRATRRPSAVYSRGSSSFGLGEHAFASTVVADLALTFSTSAGSRRSSPGWRRRGSSALRATSPRSRTPISRRDSSTRATAGSTMRSV